MTVDRVLLEKIWRCSVDEDEKGITLEKCSKKFVKELPPRMYLLNSSLGIAREMQRNEPLSLSSACLLRMLGV